ncbi:AraC family transcriptional regulator [Clostridium oryzae]|uniref:HTH-type transcriptional activator Btr n=1 Tax=Clostridium oryzae TaxID=1450648 RepID=A0A1V4IHG5_9CLOT|nr:AraC family transcriptional regulator [Clostridium oryzae]OPJ59290.1 HTH-type transcriptional activator Btr [Clostridium oryzae]
MVDKSKLYFHIHYCNHKETNEDWKDKKITRRIKHHEFFLVTGGKGCIVTEGKEYNLEKGMLFYFKKNNLHSIESDIKDPLNFLSVHFSLAYVDFHEDQWKIVEKDGLKLPVMQRFRNYKVYHIFKKLVMMWSMKMPDYEFRCKIMLQRLLFGIYNNLKQQSTNYSAIVKVEKAIKYMNDNIGRTITLQELSELVSLSPSYFSRTFREVTGYSIIEFFNKIKIDRAEALIMVEDKKIKEIAAMLGFKDEFYFSRLFKRIKGISPKEFYSRNVHGY